MTTPSFELSAQDAVSWLRDQPAESVDLLITDPAYESLEKHRADRHDDASEAQQGVEQRLVPDLPERAVRRAVRRGVSRAPPQHALLPVLRRRNDVRRQARGGAGRLPVLEAAGVGQAHDRHGLPLPRPLRVHPVLREGQAAAERSRRRRRDFRAEDPWRISGREAGRGVGGADRAELAAGRRRRRSVHGLGQRRRRGGQAGPPVPRQRSQSRGGPASRRTGCASSVSAAKPGEPTAERACRPARLDGTASHDRRRIRQSGGVVRRRGASARAASRSTGRSGSASRSSARTGASTCSASARAATRRSPSSASSRTARERSTRRSPTRSTICEALPMAGCIAYAGKGFSDRRAAHAPAPRPTPRTACRSLDQTELYGRTRRSWITCSPCTSAGGMCSSARRSPSPARSPTRCGRATSPSSPPRSTTSSREGRTRSLATCNVPRPTCGRAHRATCDAPRAFRATCCTCARLASTQHEKHVRTRLVGRRTCCVLYQSILNPNWSCRGALA